jgi:hypothetical protein
MDKEIITIIISSLSLIVAGWSLFFIWKIEKKSKEMKDEIWGEIADVGFFTSADFILKLKSNGLSKDDLNNLIAYWKYQYEYKNKNTDEFRDKYDPVVNTIKKELNK